MEISENELWTLSYYAASELAGALVLGRLAAETDDDELRAHLTRHAAEEADHARRWTKTILAVGGLPQRVAETYQARYRARFGRPSTVLEVLALTHVFEHRVTRHFRVHLRRPGTHPAVAATLRRMIADEAGHLGWIREWLAEHAQERGTAPVAGVLRRCRQVDRAVYHELVRHQDEVAALLSGGASSRPGSGGGTQTSPFGNGAATRADAALGAEVRRIVARAVRVSPDALSPTTRLEDLGTDSLDLVTVLADLEDAFRMEIGGAEAREWRTVADVAATIARLRRAAPR